MDKAVAIVSGGLDSTVLAYHARGLYPNCWFISFDYGQRHKKELEYAAKTAEKLDAHHSIVDLSGVMGPLLKGSGSSLVESNVEVPDGHYAEDTMRATVVPNRNMVMLAIATSAAVSWGAEVVYTGVHAGDHFIYPDCRPPFVNALSNAAIAGNEGFAVPGFHIEAPFNLTSKSGIVEVGARLAVPFEETWSCYKGGARHCGRCGTCVERAEAFHVAGVKDPTDYVDKEYWRDVTGTR